LDNIAVAKQKLASNDLSGLRHLIERLAENSLAPYLKLTFSDGTSY
jgi:hypothetical protein